MKIYYSLTLQIETGLKINNNYWFENKYQLAWQYKLRWKLNDNIAYNIIICTQVFTFLPLESITPWLNYIILYHPKLQATFVLPKNIRTMNCKPQNCFAIVTVTPLPWYPPAGLSTEVVYKA